MSVSALNVPANPNELDSKNTFCTDFSLKRVLLFLSQHTLNNVACGDVIAPWVEAVLDLQQC